MLPRKVLFHPRTGWAKVRQHSAGPSVVEQREREYAETIRQRASAGDVELF